MKCVRTHNEVRALGGELLGDDPVRLVLSDGTEVHGIATTCGAQRATLLTAAGTWMRVRYSDILSAGALSPASEYDAVVDAMGEAGLFVD